MTTRGPKIGDIVRLPGGRDAEFLREQGDDGRPASHFRVMDTLAQMLKNNAISQEMYDAGRMFEADFHRAFASGHGSVWPSETSGMGGSASGESTVVLSAAAAQAVRRAINAVGGYESPAASALWYVAGLGMSVREWAMHEGWRGAAMNAHAAKGILIAALGVLVREYGLVNERTGRIRVAQVVADAFFSICEEKVETFG